MLELFILGFTAFFAPIPWLITAIHLLVIKKRRGSLLNKMIFLFVAVTLWISIDFWLVENNPLILSTTLAPSSLAKFFGIVVLLCAVMIEILTSRALTIKRVLGSSELQQTKDKLITTGIYYYARHPRYIEHPFWFLGLGLLFGYPFLLFFSLYLFLSFLVTAYVEEQELLARYGNEYRAYKKKTPAFFVG